MKKTSTQHSMSDTMTISNNTRGPKAQTIAILKQFARVYTPTTIGSIVIN